MATETAENKVRRLIKEIESGDRNVRRRATYAIGRIGKAAVPHLVKEADLNESISVRLAAVSALGNIHAAPKSSIPCLCRALSDDSPEVRRASIFALRRFGRSAEEAIPDLAATAVEDTDAQVRTAAVMVLGDLHLDPSTSVHCLTLALSDESADVRRESAVALGNFGSHATPAVAEITRTVVDDMNKGVQTAALKTLGTLGASAIEAMPTLLDVLLDEDPKKSRLAAAALRRIGLTTRKSTDAILAATKEARPHVRRNAAWVLGAGGDLSQQTVPRLIELLRDKDETVVRTTLLALGSFGHDAAEAVAPIIEATKSDNPVVSALAEQALRQVAPDRVSKLVGKPFDTVQAYLDDIKDFRVAEQDWPQLGGSRFRNNTPAGTNIPTTWNVGKFDRRTGAWDSSKAANIKWFADLGSQTYGNPVVANGKIYVGTNNGAGYLRRYPPVVDLGCLLCFRVSDGKFLWQHSSEKLPTGRVHDWPLQGICSAPVVQGDRLWFVTSRGEVACLDTEGFYDNDDDGPETGVRRQLFDAATDLSALKSLSANRSIPFAFRQTLARVLRAAGLEAQGGYLKIRDVEKPGTLTVGSYDNHPLICRISFKGKNLKVLALAGGEQLLEVNTDLLEGLDDGKLSAALRTQLSASGVDIANDQKVRVVEPGSSWEITTGAADQTRAFRLLKNGRNIVCDEHVTPALKSEADVVWKFDMMKELGVSQHNMATCAPTIWGDTLFICTSNGVDESHAHIPAPDAPSFIAIDKHSGRVLWTDNSPGKNILHGQWSCPVVAVFDDVPQVIFPGGDGWLYSFRADRWKDEKPELLWKFDANPKESKWVLGGAGTRNNLIAVPVIYDGLVYVAVGQDPEHGEGEGHLWCIDPTKRGDVSPDLVFDSSGEVVPHRRVQAATVWEQIGKSNAKIWDGLDDGLLSESLQQAFQTGGVLLPEDYSAKTIVAGRQWMVTATIGGVEELFRLNANTRINRGQERHSLSIERKVEETVVPNPNSAVVWHYEKFDQDGDGEIDFEEEFHRSIGSPTLKNDLLVIADFSGLVHCLNAKTGTPFWTCDLLAQCWSTPLIVEDKVYVGDEDGDVAILDLSPDPSSFTEDGSDPNAGSLVPLHEINMGASVYSTPIVANNVLYIANKTRLFAIETSGDGSW